MNALLFNATPLLPHDTVQGLGLLLSWGLVLATSAVWALRRWSRITPVQSKVLLAALIAWCFMAGPVAPSYWLGLAFQVPSLGTVLLCIWYLRNFWRGQPTSQEFSRGLLTICGAGVLIGWLLLLDMLAWLPWQIYAMGFSPLVVAALLFIALLPWMLLGRSAMSDDRTWIAPLAVVIFVAIRWPSGNVWDAVLDPWLWLLLNGFAIRSIWKQKSAV